MWGSDFKFVFLAPALLVFLFSLYAGGETLPERANPKVQDIFPIEKEKLCPHDKPNCQAKSCMEQCLAEGEEEDVCLEDCVQYASHPTSRSFCKN